MPVLFIVRLLTVQIYEFRYEFIVGPSDKLLAHVNIEHQNWEGEGWALIFLTSFVC